MPGKISIKKLDPDQDITQRWRASEILLLGGSAGAFKILFSIVKMLPVNLNKAVVIVMHRNKNFKSEMEGMFAQNSRMQFKAINDKDEIKKNTIYVAPPNYHTLIENGKYFSLDVSEPLWYSKPSIDVTFETAADSYHSKCTAVLLSGANRDGAEGLLQLRLAGSLTIAQQPEDAEMPEMPLAAISLGAAGYVLTAAQIFDLLTN